MLAFFWSREFLLSRSFLWLNFGGTIYGYIWYEGQLIETFNEHALWKLVFVPDSPTASLFFTLAILYLLFPPQRSYGITNIVRHIIEGLAVVCSVKYGIWAVSMIVAGAGQGGELNWQDYMLMASHLGMAFEALLFLRFMKAGWLALVVATGWLLLNDTVDYTYGVYPYLPSELHDDVSAVKLFTYSLSLFSLGAALLVWRFRKKV
jgi:uncharacterized membrane protein YpjA